MNNLLALVCLFSIGIIFTLGGIFKWNSILGIIRGGDAFGPTFNRIISVIIGVILIASAIEVMMS